MGIRVENLHKSYGPDKVLNGLDLDIPDRSFFSVVAPTGAGKTTLLRILVGIESLDKGTVYYDGEDVADRSVQERSVGMVYQEFVNYPSLTVFENLASPLRASTDLSEEEIRQQVHETAEMLSIEHRLDNLPEEVSGGEAQRTAISRALINEPDYLFMDEPLANLDYKLREELRSEFERLFQELETTVIYATPISGDALSMSTHIGYLYDGEILEDKPKDEIYYRPETLPVAEYLGEPPMNMLPVTVVEEQFEPYFEFKDGTRIWAEGFDLEEGKTYELGFRPQDMKLDGEDGEGERTIHPDLAFVETVGSTSTLHLEFQGEEIYALSGEPVHLDTDTTLSYTLDPEKLYVYDPDSEHLLATGDKIPSFS
ncbi:MAG: ABC transporter ATP-binding protein [Bacteroidetes bacterium SW_9_63_38]|nr:MAG: ABC transporter ATP-binding protein [Bacteroidetes bacterium SW_9_63_38]